MRAASALAPSPEGGPEDALPAGLARWVSGTLRTGVGLSAMLALAGLALLLAGPTASFQGAALHGAAFSGPAFLTGLSQGQGVDVLLLACLVLLATPLIRVVISVPLFARVGDRPFTVLTLTVLLLLGVSVLIGAIA